MKPEIAHYSPIIVGVYNRFSHFKQCIESLAACPEAKESTLFVASDAAYRDEDSESIRILRDYIEEISGFKNVVKIIRPENVGALNNYTKAIEQVLKDHDTFIVMEDDVVVGKGFLHFMNQGLKLYYNEPKIIGISGYLPPTIQQPDGKPFFLRSVAPYGAAYWRDKFIELNKIRTKDYFSNFYKSFKKFKEYEKLAPHVARALPRIVHGSESFGDIEIEIVMLDMGFLALYPPRAISKSIGHDGTGIHSGKNTSLQYQVISEQFYDINTEQMKNIELDKAIEKKISNSRRSPFAYFLNYTIFFFNKYVPKYYFLYNFFRKIVKRLR